MSHYSNDWQQSQMHSPRELERRLTQLEDLTEAHAELHERHEEATTKLRDRMTWHERAITAIVGVLQILAQDKFPAIIKLLRGATQ
jgi:hypothetical protein